MNRYCLDSCTYSEHIRGRESAAKALKSARELLIPVIVLGELRAGFRMGSMPGENEEILQRFLRKPVVRVVEATEETSELYADLVTELRKTGKAIPTNDIWIAATALQEGARVVTYDGHFRYVPLIRSVILKAE